MIESCLAFWQRAGCFVWVVFVSSATAVVCADSGDPQIRTDHPWYPGELAISTFDRLFSHQDELYQRVTGIEVDSDEDKALASWVWRNTHYWHGEAGKRDLWGEGFRAGKDMRPREYWSGLFAFGFGLCGTTHSQWTAEFQQRLGHARARGVGAAGHNAMEVFLKAGPYGSGRWALVDHDLSTVIFDASGSRLLGLGEMQPDVDQWINRSFKPQRQRGWLVCGLHPDDGSSYRRYAVAEYLPGYSGPPPMVHLRRGESMRRYFQPGLEDGNTFVFWGRNYNTAGIPGPERSRTWVNQPDAMYGSRNGTPHRDGQVRFANVQYVYQPDFSSNDYQEGIVRETEHELVFEFQTPYIIAATPPNDDAWGIYDAGCRNGLVVEATSAIGVSVSVDCGRNWSDTLQLNRHLDLTDAVKGRSQYWIRFDQGRRSLRDAELRITTVCQANVAVLPRLKDGGTTVTFQSGDRRVRSLGPELEIAKTFLVDGDFGQPTVTLQTPVVGKAIEVHAAAHIASGSPPNPEVAYQIELSGDGGNSWQSLVEDWNVSRVGDEPNDFWSQSFCYGSAAPKDTDGKSLKIRFRNDGGKRYLRAEAHIVESTGQSDPVRVTYDWTDSTGNHRHSEVMRSGDSCYVETGENVQTNWVELRPVADRP